MLLNMLLLHVRVRCFLIDLSGFSIRLMYLRRGAGVWMRRTSDWAGRARRRKIPAINETGYGPSIFIAERPSTPCCTLPPPGVGAGAVGSSRRLRNNASWTVILAAAPRDLRLDAQPFLRTFSSLPTRKYPWITLLRINQQMHCSKLFLSGTLGAHPRGDRTINKPILKYGTTSPDFQ